ncbi:hypothetical protein PUN28_009569 [Cardiocondyla obscurior]
MTEIELRQALKNIEDSNLLLRLENDIFERYLARRDPGSLQKIAQILETAKRIQKIALQHVRTTSVISATGNLVSVSDKESVSVANVQSGSQHVTPSLLTAETPTGEAKIPFVYRIEMVNTEIRELKRAIIKFEQTFVKRRIHLRAQLEENQISIHEICKSREDFEENVVQKGFDSITGKMSADKFIRFIEEWLKTIDIVTEKIRLKVATIKCQIRKVTLQLNQRKEVGEALRAVDFEQLRIENRICVQKIDEKNQHLLEMKKIAGRYSIALSKHKEKVEGLILTMNEVKTKIVSKSQELVKLQSEQIATKAEIKKTEKRIKSMTVLMNKFKVPNAVEFIKMRMKLQELQRIRKQLSRQRDIQRAAIKFRK